MADLTAYRVRVPRTRTAYAYCVRVRVLARKKNAREEEEKQVARMPELIHNEQKQITSDIMGNRITKLNKEIE